MANARFDDIKYIDGYNSWFDMLLSDIEGTINTIYRNMQADIDAGRSYDYVKRCYQSDIDTMMKKHHDLLDKYVEYDDNKKFERYCFTQLLKNGAID